MPLDTPQSHCQTPSTGEPDAGKPPVRFGGRGDINTVVPTPIYHPVPPGQKLRKTWFWAESLAGRNPAQAVSTLLENLGGTRMH
jgi:hypothetical protein